MTSQQPHDWQWDDSQWGQSPAAPTNPEQVPEDPDDTPGWLRRLMAWAAQSS